MLIVMKFMRPHTNVYLTTRYQARKFFVRFGDRAAFWGPVLVIWGPIIWDRTRVEDLIFYEPLLPSFTEFYMLLIKVQTPIEREQPCSIQKIVRMY